jgi:uncharacterized protein
MRNSIIENNIGSITNICRQYNVKYLYVFGSVLSPNFTDTSDIDFLVYFEEIDPLLFGDYYFGLENELQNVLHRPIIWFRAEPLKIIIF